MKNTKDMKNIKDFKRGFVSLSRSWFGECCPTEKGVIDAITIEVDELDGDIWGEFEINWMLIGKGESVARISIFDGCWDAFFHCTDLIEKMKEIDGQNISPDDFCKMLVELGFEDLTKSTSDI